MTGVSDGHFRFSASPIFEKEGFVLWQFKVQTLRSEQYRIVTGVAGGRGGAETYGVTVPGDTNSGSGCFGTIWIAVSLITLQEHSVAKTIISHGTGTITATRLADPQEVEMRGIISLARTPDLRVPQMNKPFVLGHLDGLEIRLMVGPDAYAWNGEPDGPANGSQPSSPDEIPASRAADSRR